MLQMLEIPEEVLENLLAALARMNIGFVLYGTVEAALQVMRENRLGREHEKLAVLEEPPTLWEWQEGEEEADRTSPGIPVASPIEPLKEPPTGPIPFGGPLPPPASTPQVGHHLPTTASTWKAVQAALQFRDRDRQCHRARADLFAAFQKLMGGHSEPPKAAKGWWRLVEGKQKELRHTAVWLAARTWARWKRALEEEAERRQAEEE